MSDRWVGEGGREWNIGIEVGRQNGINLLGKHFVCQPTGCSRTIS